jgi:hypothetical protein
MELWAAGAHALRAATEQWSESPLHGLEDHGTRKCACDCGYDYGMGARYREAEVGAAAAEQARPVNDERVGAWANVAVGGGAERTEAELRMNRKLTGEFLHLVCLALCCAVDLGEANGDVDGLAAGVARVLLEEVSRTLLASETEDGAVVVLPTHAGGIRHDGLVARNGVVAVFAASEDARAIADSDVVPVVVEDGAGAVGR